MPRAVFNDIAIRNIKPPEQGQLDLWDASLPKFGIRCARGGAKTWVLKHNNRRITLGHYPVISLAQARVEAKRLLAQFTLGHNHQQSVSFSAALQNYLVQHQRTCRPRTHSEARRILTSNFKLFQHKRLNAISKHDINWIIGSLAHAPSAARHAFNCIKAMMRWCVQEDYLQNTPLEAARGPAKSLSRSHVIKDADLRSILLQARVRGFPYGTILLFLALSGQRRTEIASLRWSFIDTTQQTICLPPSLTKNKKQHLFPYGPTLAAILQTLPRSGDLLFPARANPSKPFSGWSRCKEAFDKNLKLSEPYTLHDFRRTSSTIMAREKLAPIHVVEALLNHLSGTRTPIQRVYDIHDYLPEMREAVTKFDQYLAALLAPS